MVPTIFPPWSHLLGKLKLLILCKSFPPSNLYSDLPSGITPSTWYWEALYPITSFLAWSAIFLSCQLLTVLPGPYARSNFRRWAKLTSIFLILSFHLEQQAWLRACVESVVLIAFHFILPFLLDGIFIESLDKICRDHRQHFGFFRDVNWIHG